MRSPERVVDEVLVLAAQAGEAEALEILAERWHSRLLRLALVLTRDEDGAHEAVQEAWLGIVRGLKSLKNPARFGSWALSITRRRCTDWIASRVRRRRHAALLEDAAAVRVKTRTGDGRLSRVVRALRGLSEGYRVPMTLFYVEGLSVAEIADVLGIPAGTVKSRLFHGRAKVRRSLEEDHERV